MCEYLDIEMALKLHLNKLFKIINQIKQNCLHDEPPQPAFTCSKLTIETLEQGVKHVQS